MDTFGVIFGTHLMHTICRFESREVRSPTLQTVCKSELKRRSYDYLKTTASTYAKISQLQNELRNFAAQSPFRSCEMSWETHRWPTSAILQPMPPSSQLRTTLRNHLQAANEVANHLQVAESSPSCKTKVQTCKMDNSTCESPCEIHLCKLRYLQLT